MGPRLGGLASALEEIDAKHRDDPDFCVRDDGPRDEQEAELCGDEAATWPELWGYD